MATYKEIQNRVKIVKGFVPKSCWIAHVKEMDGLKPRKAYNRLNSNKRANPCPETKVKFIREALKYFKMI